MTAYNAARQRFMRNALFAATIILATLILLSPSGSQLTSSAATAAATNAATVPATAEAQNAGPSLKWPVTPATEAQIDEAKACDIDNLVKTRYPNTMGVAALPTAFEPKTACDWAVLAVAYAARHADNEPVAPAGIDAFKRAISANSALAFKLPILSGYFGTQNFVDAPPFASQPITQVEIHHTFSGLGEQIAYSYTISQANTDKPRVSGKSGVGKTKAISGAVNKALVQSLGTALVDLIPMRAQYTQEVCTDDYPDWTVTLTFKDKTTVKLLTNRSNIFFSGGPWQTIIAKQNYTQYSNRFLVVLLDIGKALQLPADETSAMYCHGLDEDPFTQAFPESAATPAATKQAR